MTKHQGDAAFDPHPGEQTPARCRVVRIAFALSGIGLAPVKLSRLVVQKRGGSRSATLLNRFVINRSRH